MTHIDPYQRAHAERRRRSGATVRAALAVLLAVVLAWGQVPTAAWAAALTTPATEGVEENAPEGASSQSSGTAGKAGQDASGAGATSGTAGSMASDGAGSPEGTGEQGGSQDGAGVTANTAATITDSAASGDAGAQGAATTASAAGTNALTAATDTDKASAREGETISVSAQVIGRDTDGEVQNWTAATTIEVPAGSTAADVSEQLFEQSGITADYGDSTWGWSLNTITDPNDPSRALGYDAATERYWQLFVNGTPSSVGAGSVTLNPGDRVVWFYSAYGESLPDAGAADEQVNVTVTIYGMSRTGVSESWVAQQSVALDADETAADAIVRTLEENNITYSATSSSYGLFFQSITSPYDSENTLSYDGTNYWQLLVNGSYSMVGASSVKASEGASYAMVFGSDGTLPGMISVSFEIYGINASGEVENWGSRQRTVAAGTTAAEFTELMLTEMGIPYEKSDTAYGWMLQSVTSPDGRELAYDQGTGAYWQFWHNGSCSMVGAGDVTLAAGDSVDWYFAPDETAYPDNGVVAHPDAERPAWEGVYGFAQGETGAATPTDKTQQAWLSQLKETSDWQTNVSDPLVAHGFVYVCAGNQLLKLDAATGEELGRAALVNPVDSVARMVMVDGLIIVPLKEGRLQALTGDALTTVWMTSALPPHATGGAQQSLGSLTVSGGYLYAATASADWTTSYNGYLTCVDIDTGEVVWQRENTGSGFYWGGAAVSGPWVVVVDDAGTVTVSSASTGQVASSLSLGAGSRAQVVKGSAANTFWAVTKDGTLSKLVVDEATGQVSTVGSVRFGSSSTATPTVSGGRVYVCGSSIEGYANSWGGTSYHGVLAVVNEDTLAVEYSITKTTDGNLPAEVKSAPLVSVQGGSTYVYLTCNAEPGGVYRYRLGDAAAKLIYTPDEEHQNYCMASVVCGEDGVLYYVNDSGALFAIKAAPADTDDDETTPDTPKDDGTGDGPGTTNDNGSDDDTHRPNGDSDGRPHGTVSPTHTPVAAKADGDAADDAADDADAEAAEAVDGAEGGARAIATSVEPDEADARAGGTINWLPIAGIAAGVAGLLAIGIYLVATRRRNE